MATSCKVLQRDCVYYKKGTIIIIKICFVICSYIYPLVTLGCVKAVDYPSQWRASYLLVKKKKNLADNLPTSRRQPHLTTYHAACNADTVWSAGESRLTREAAWLPLTITIYLISIRPREHPTSPTDLSNMVIGLHFLF